MAVAEAIERPTLHPSLDRTHTDRDGRRYRVVTTYRRPGRRFEIPEMARGVSVEPLSDGSAVRITYLRPLREVSFEDADAARYIN